MERPDPPLVPVQILALTLDLAAEHGVPRDTLLDRLGLPADLRQLLLPGRVSRTVARPESRELVRECLAQSLSSRLPSLVQMAERLHVSPRTLKRHLRQQGTSYRRLLDERRAQACSSLLLEPNLNLETIAERLGYSTAANFSRAFHRWAGVTPGTHRARLRDGRH